MLAECGTSSAQMGSETLGEELDLWVCNKHGGRGEDPESGELGDWTQLLRWKYF